MRRDIHNHVPRNELRILKRLGYILNRTSRHARGFEPFDPIGLGSGQSYGLHQAFEQTGVLTSRSVRRKSGVVGKAVQTENSAKLSEQGVVARGDHEQAILGVEGFERRDRRVPRTGTTGRGTGGACRCYGVFQDGQLAVQHCYIHLTAAACDLSFVKCRCHPLRKVKSRDDVTDRCANPHRIAIFLAGDRHHSAPSLNHHVIGGLIHFGSGVTESGNCSVNQPWVLFVKGVPAVSQFLHRARAIVFQEDI